MMNRMGYLLVVFLLTLGYWLISPPVIRAQPLTHVVQKGEITLWDICEKYYGTLIYAQTMANKPICNKPPSIQF